MEINDLPVNAAPTSELNIELSDGQRATLASLPIQSAVTNALALKAPLASPALTGTPTAPTAATTTSTTQLATTAFVQQELLAGGSTSRSLVVSVRNQSGGTMAAGTIVYINGATGNLPTIAKAIAISDATSAQTIGLVQTSIANNGTGLVVVRGVAGSLDTSALTEGQQLYLSPSVAGTYTTTKQYAPNHLVYIGIVTRAHPTQGSIEVAVQNGFEMDELHNVSAQSPANGDTLRWNSSTSLWEKSAAITNLATDLAAETARATAAENPSVGSLAALTSLVDSVYSNGAFANVRGALIDGDDLGGLWRLDLTDSSTTVDGRTVVASQSGKRWKRVRDYSAFGDDQLIQGREYMTAFQAKLLTQAAASIVMSGDSTTAGDSATTPYRVWEIIPNLAANLGFPNVTATNAGHSGGGSATWLSTWLATDLALNPDCYIVRWGLNDPTNQSDYLNAQVIINNLRTGLAAIRAAKTIAQMSVVVMMPNSCTDDPAWRTAAWFRELRQGFQKAARDYKCAFFDTYTLLRDSSFGQWINEDYSPGSGRYVHPLNIGNVIICGELSDLLFPRGFNLTAQGAGIPNTVFPVGNKIGSDSLSSYPLGLSIYPCTTAGSGTVFQYQGYVVTFKQASSYGFQINIFANNAPAGIAGGVGVWAIRHGFANTGGGGVTGWSNWWNAARGDTTFIGDTALSFSNGWANFGTGMRNLSYNRSVDGIVQVSGLVAGGTFTPYGATTVIATLPAGCRPVKTAWFLVPCAANATDGSQLYATVLVTPAGEIQVFKATGNYYLALDQVSFSINT